MDIQIYANGGNFQRKSSDLKSAIQLLECYENTYSQCLKLSSAKHGLVPVQVKSSIRLTEITQGSLLVKIVTETGAAIAPLAPELFNYTWLLYKAGYDLIGIVTKYFRRNQEPMQVNIQDSEINAPVIVVSGDGRACNVTGDVFLAASAMHKTLPKYAEFIENRNAEDIKISSPGQQSLVFDSENYQNYKRYSKKAKESEPVEIQCNITRFNKKTLNGVLEIYEEEEIFIKPFSVSPDIVDDCLDAFKADLVTISAIREVEINALNETSVIRYHAIDISIV